MTTEDTKLDSDLGSSSEADVLTDEEDGEWSRRLRSRSSHQPQQQQQQEQMRNEQRIKAESSLKQSAMQSLSLESDQSVKEAALSREAHGRQASGLIDMSMSGHELDQIGAEMIQQMLSLQEQNSLPTDGFLCFSPYSLSLSFISFLNVCS